MISLNSYCLCSLSYAEITYNCGDTHVVCRTRLSRLVHLNI